MTQLNLPNLGKKIHAANNPMDQRSNIIARIALNDLLVFHDALEAQIHQMLLDTQTRMPLDNELFEKMLAAQDSYVKVMRGFNENESIAQRNALIAFADAVQDIMVCYNRRRRH